MNRPVVLASASPRRKELLNRFIPEFEVLPADTDETFFPEKGIDSEIARITKQKADAVVKLRPGSVIIAADTIVVKNNSVLGKPTDKQDALRMLKMLRGSAHQVKSCVNVASPEGWFSFVENTSVIFRDYSDELINWYVSTGEPFGKAGAYAIQGFGCVLSLGIEGDFNNVVGLPLSSLIHRLCASGLYRFSF